MVVVGIVSIVVDKQERFEANLDRLRGMEVVRLPVWIVGVVVTKSLEIL